MSNAQCQQLRELQKKARCTKSKMTPESSRALEARVVMLEAKTGNNGDESLFADKKPQAKNRNNLAFGRVVQILDGRGC